MRLLLIDFDKFFIERLTSVINPTAIYTENALIVTRFDFW